MTSWRPSPFAGTRGAWPHFQLCDGRRRLFVSSRFRYDGAHGHDPGPIVDPAPERWKMREAEFRSIWAGLTLRNDRIRAAVPITFRPLDDSIRDCVESLLAVAHVVPKRRPD